VLVSYNPETMELISIDVLPAEEPIEEPVPEEPKEQTQGFEAYLALGAIGLAGAAVALTHRKK